MTSVDHTAVAATGDPRTARTQAALRAAMLTLLEEKPFDQLTVRDITARADVGYATFFRRYPDKEALLNDVAAREIGQLLAMTLPILFTVDSRASTQALCAYLWEHRKLWSALLTGGASATLKQEFVRQAQELAANNTSHHTWLPGDLAVVFAVSATVEILSWWLNQTNPPSVAEMAEILDSLVVTPSLSTGPLPRP